MRLTGSIPLADEEFGTLAQVFLLNSILTVAGVALLLWLALRSVRIIFAILLTLVVGLGITAAFGLLAVGPYNPISLAFAVLFIGLGVDFGIQFAVRYRAERHSRGQLREALVAAGAGVGGSIALATASIAAGFYAFLPTDYTGVSELGLIAGTGMLVAFVLSLTLLPALLSLLRPRGEAGEIGYHWMAPLDRFLIHRRRLVLTFAGILALGFATLLPRLSFDFNPLNLRSPKTESVATILDLMKDRSTSPYTIEVLAPSLAGAQKEAERLAKLPEVAQVITLASFVPKDQDAKLALIQDATMLIGPTLEPDEIKPAPTDKEVVASLRRAAAALDKAADSSQDRPSRRARRLARLASALAAAPPAPRAEAEAQIIPGLKATVETSFVPRALHGATHQPLPRPLPPAGTGFKRIGSRPTGGRGSRSSRKAIPTTTMRCANSPRRC